jgi:flagellar hook-associated protein 3 FlgL
MIDISSQMLYRLDNLNSQSERISYQMSTGKVLENGSDNSVLFTRYIDIESKLRDQEGIKTQIDKTIAQNNVSDDNITELKNTIDLMKQDILKSLNAGMTRSDREAVATNIAGMRDNLLRIANTSVDGEYIYAGSNTTVQPYVKDANFVINGKIEFEGNNHLRQVAVGAENYRPRGITAVDLLMYNTDTTAGDNTISFNKNEKVFDQAGYEWRFLQTTDAAYTNTGSLNVVDINNGNIVYNQATSTYYRAKNDFDSIDLSSEVFTNTTNWEAFSPEEQIFRVTQDGNISDDYLSVTDDGKNPATFTSDDIVNPSSGSSLADTTKIGLTLESKHNFFDDLNVVINALNGYGTVATDGATDGQKGAIIDDESVRSILADFTDKVDQQYNATNIGHSELGGRNKVFETYLESISAKVTHYNILIQETNGADLSKLAMESKSLEMTYTAMFSTVAKMNQLSLVNFIK